jgi:hypothetical protein
LSFSKRKLELEKLTGNKNGQELLTNNNKESPNKENENLNNKKKYINDQTKSNNLNTSQITQKLPLCALPTASKSPTPHKSNQTSSNSILESKKLTTIEEVENKSIRFTMSKLKHILSDEEYDEEEESEKMRKESAFKQNQSKDIQVTNQTSPVLNASTNTKRLFLATRQSSNNAKQLQSLLAQQQQEFEISQPKDTSSMSTKNLKELKNKLHSTYMESPTVNNQKSSRLDQVRNTSSNKKYAPSSPSQLAFNDSIRRKSTNLSMMTNDIERMNEAPLEEDNDEVVIGSGDFFNAVQKNKAITLNETKSTNKSNVYDFDNKNKTNKKQVDEMHDDSMFTNLKEVKSTKSSIKISKITVVRPKSSNKNQIDKEKEMRKEATSSAPPLPQEFAEPQPPQPPTTAQQKQQNHDQTVNQSTVSTRSMMSSQPIKDIDCDMPAKNNSSKSTKATSSNSSIKLWLQKQDEVNNSSDERELAALQSKNFIRRSVTSNNRTSNNTTTYTTLNSNQSLAGASVLLSNKAKSKKNMPPPPPPLPSTSNKETTPVLLSNKANKSKNKEESASPVKKIKSTKQKELRDDEEEQTEEVSHPSNRSSRSREKKNTTPSFNSTKTNNNEPTTQFEVFDDNNEYNSNDDATTSPIVAKKRSKTTKSKLSDKTNTKKQKPKEKPTTSKSKQRLEKEKNPTAAPASKRTAITRTEEQANDENSDQPLALRRSKRVIIDHHKSKPIYEFERVKDFDGRTIMVRKCVAIEEKHDWSEDFIKKEMVKQNLIMKQRKQRKKRAASSSISPKKTTTKSRNNNNNANKKKPSKKTKKIEEVEQEAAESDESTEIEIKITNDQLNNNEQIVQNDPLSMTEPAADNAQENDGNQSNAQSTQNSLQFSVDENNLSNNSRVNSSNECILMQCEDTHNNQEEGGEPRTIAKNIYCFMKKSEQREYEEISDGVHIHAQAKGEGILKIDSLKSLKTHIHENQSITYVVQKGHVVFSINGTISRHSTADIIKVPKSKTVFLYLFVKL